LLVQIPDAVFGEVVGAADLAGALGGAQVPGDERDKQAAHEQHQEQHDDRHHERLAGLLFSAAQPLLLRGAGGHRS
jgi:hypothetical protein